jgi:uncharacterized membrane protein
MNIIILFSILIICWTIQPFFKKIPLKKITSAEYYILNHVIYSIPIFIYIIYMLYNNNNNNANFNFLYKLDKSDYIYCISTVVVGIIGGYTFMLLLKNNNATYVIPHIQPIIITLTVLVGYFIFNEELNYKHLIGMGLIILGLIILNLGNYK